MPPDKKRKQGPGGGGDATRGEKRRQGGSGGKWQTPHSASKFSNTTPRGGSIDPGDVGIWATCMMHKEGKATQELKVLFEEYAERIYGVKAPTLVDGQEGDVDGKAEADIEDSVQAELSGMQQRKKGGDKSKLIFEPVFIESKCVLFWKTRPPVVPTEFVAKICEDAAAGEKRKCRFINRLTPMSGIGKASETGLKEVGRQVLGDAGFDLALQEGEEAEVKHGSSFSYAIRPTIRNHSMLKRDVVIPLVADLVGKRHKVNLAKPDKVILIEIYQSICGMAVVDGPTWDGELKRFNLFEIYEASEGIRKGEKREGSSAAEVMDGKEVEAKQE